MFSVKRNVLELVALFKSYGIKHIVASPGSRNAPLLHSFSQDPYFDCHVVVDERNAAFYALGMMQALHKPVAVCCTSGTALLNYAPAVAEAFYQQLPLIVVSADRSPEWIGQMDGQTLPQANVYGRLVKKSVHLPEIVSDTDKWYCNRLCNEALIAATTGVCAPVHINIPISEPLFDYSQAELPDARRISFAESVKNIDIHPFVDQWNASSKRMIVVGQSKYSDELIQLLIDIQQKTDCVVLTEHLSNCVSETFVSNFDAVLTAVSVDEKDNYIPDLVISLGGHIVSKRLKHFLRVSQPDHHWHLSPSGEVVDLFQSLTHVVESGAEHFIAQLLEVVEGDIQKSFSDVWNAASSTIIEPDLDSSFSDISVTGHFLQALPSHSVLHLANSSIVRNAQLFVLPKSVDVLCNRGTNGIEGTIPSTIGFASVSNKPIYVMTGDLSFFYGLNALWNIESIQNLRILLINNGGGGIFHLLPNLNTSSSLTKYVAAEHATSAQKWVDAAEIDYLSAANDEELKKSLVSFFDERRSRSVVLEVFTEMEINKKATDEYYKSLKK